MPSSPLDEKLMVAASKHNFQEVRALVEQGANVNYIKYTGGDAWYKGNTNTPLYQAVHSKFQSEEAYILVIQYLLKKGANPNFQATRGGWNHYNMYPIFSHVIDILSKLSSDELKLRFIGMFVQHGININIEEHQGREKDFKVWQTHNCFIFDVLDQCGLPSKVEELQKPFASQIIKKMKKQKQDRQRKAFDELYPNKLKEVIQQNNQDEQGQQSGDQQESQIKAKKANIQKSKIEMIVKILSMGVNPNSSKSSSRWENYNIHNYSQENKDLAKYESYENEQYENLLHRAITYDLPELVKQLLQRGADTSRSLKYSISKILYPNQWPKKLKAFRTKQNNSNLKEYQKEKYELLKRLQKQNEQSQKTRILNNVRYYEFLIYQCQTFDISNECPVCYYEVRQLNCIELAAAFNTCQEITQMLKTNSNQKLLTNPSFYSQLSQIPNSKSRTKKVSMGKKFKEEANKKVEVGRRPQVYKKQVSKKEQKFVLPQILILPAPKIVNLKVSENSKKSKKK